MLWISIAATLIALIVAGITVGLTRRWLSNARFLIEPPSYRVRLNDRLFASRYGLLTAHPPEDIVLKKKAAIVTMGPKTFYYLDSDQVRDLHDQVGEVQPREIETQESDSGLIGGSINLKFVQPKAEKSSSQSTKKRYELQLTSVSMYNRVEEVFFEDGHVTFGIEDFDYDESGIEEFQSVCKYMEEQFNFPIPEDLQDKFKLQKAQEAAAEKVRALSALSGYAAVQAEFTVQTLGEKFCELSLDHPVNSTLQGGGKVVKIVLNGSMTCLQPAGSAAFSVGNSVKLTTVGKIVRWEDSSDLRLIINPIAIY